MTDIIEKYKDRVDPEHRMAMEAVGFAAQILEGHSKKLQEFLDAERRSHGYMHITDPTLYRDMIQSKNFELQVRIAKAAVQFLREIEAVGRELGI